MKSKSTHKITIDPTTLGVTSLARETNDMVTYCSFGDGKRKTTGTQPTEPPTVPQTIQFGNGGHEASVKTLSSSLGMGTTSAYCNDDLNHRVMPKPMTAKSSTGTRSVMQIDMTMGFTEETMRKTIKEVVRDHLFRYVKFFDREQHGCFSTDEDSACGLILKYGDFIVTSETEARKWWNLVRQLVVQTLGNHRNNCIKALRKTFIGKNWQNACFSCRDCISDNPG